MTDNDKISSTQLWMLIVMVVIGVGIFSLPRAVTEAAGPDGWITVIICGVLCLFDFKIMCILARRFPGDTLVEMCQKVFGKLIAFLFLISFGLYLLISISNLTRIFGEVIKKTLLHMTPIEVVIIGILIATLLLIRGGIEPIVRFCTVIFPIVYITLFLVAIIALQQCDFTNILPILRSTPQEIASGTFLTIFSYAGFEIILLIVPFISNKDKMFRSGTIAISIITITYVIVVILSLGVFGIYEIKQIIWPTLTMIRSIEVPGSFVEKLEGLVMMQWIFFAFTSLIVLTYGVALIVSRILKHNDQRHFCSAIIPMVYIIALLPGNVVEAFDFNNISFTYLGIFSMFALPILLYIVSSLRRMGARGNA